MTKHIQAELTRQKYLKYQVFRLNQNMTAKDLIITSCDVYIDSHSLLKAIKTKEEFKHETDSRIIQVALSELHHSLEGDNT